MTIRIRPEQSLNSYFPHKPSTKRKLAIEPKLTPILEEEDLKTHQVAQKVLTRTPYYPLSSPLVSIRSNQHEAAIIIKSLKAKENVDAERRDLLRRLWLNMSKESLNFRIIEALERGFTSPSLDLLDAPILAKFPIYSDKCEPNLYFIFFEAVKYDQKAFVYKAAKKFCESKQFIEETLRCPRQEPKLILYVAAILMDNFNALGKVLSDKNFKIEESHKNNFLTFLKFLSKQTDKIPMVLNSRLSEFIDPNHLSVLLLLNVFNSHHVSVELLLNSPHEIPIVVISNALTLALDLEDAPMFTILEKSRYHKKIQEMKSELKAKLKNAPKEEVEKIFVEAINSENSWLLEKLSDSSSITKISPKILAEALIKIASTPNVLKFTTDFTTNLFFQIMIFTSYVKIPIDETGWGSVLVQASRNGYEDIVKKILSINNILNECDINKAIEKAKQNGHQNIENILQEYKDNLP